jgi:hypothetical protein
MKYVLVAILILIIVYFVISLITSHRKRLNLIHYVIMLLLEDDIWQKHKQQLKDWVNTQEGLRNRSELLQRSYYPI